MTLPVRRAPWRLSLGLLSLAFLLLLAALFAFLPPDGAEGAAWLQFLGRFHLLTVHFPIALILLVPIFELAGRRLPYLRTSIAFLLALAMFSSMAAAILGWFLARNGAYAGRLVTQHMWGGLCVAAACWVCWTLREYFPGLDVGYWRALAVTVSLVSFTGYRGGQLTQGENHLTEQMPRALRRMLGLPIGSADIPRSNPAFFYGARVEPIFVTHCYECHGPEKQKGRLRLDTYESLMRGGKHGAAIKAGNARGSELFRRVSLPSSDDDAMPPQAKPPLTANEIKVLELWIAAGASPSLAANGIKDAPAIEAPAAAAVTFAEIDPAVVTKSRAALGADVAQLRQRFPDALDYESRGSANLVLDASALGARFGDDDLAAMKPVSGQIVVADLSGTAITDRSAPLLAAMKSARVLRFTHTKISDSTVLALRGLDQLESLDLYGTVVTSACLESIGSWPRLRHLYAGATKIPADVPLSPDMKEKLVF